MHLKLLILFLLISSTSYAEDFVCPDSSYLKSASQSNCSAVPDNLVPSQRDIADKVPQKYRKVVSNLLEEMTQAEKDAVDAQEISTAAAVLLSTSRAGAKDSVDQLSSEGVRLRAALLVILDRFNLVTERIDAIENCIEANSTVANIRTCVSNLAPVLGQATATQMKNAIKTKIDGGLAD